MMGSYPFDLSDRTIARADPELVRLYRERRCLAAAKADILVHKTRAKLRALQRDRHERVIHTAIINGKVIPIVVPHDNREPRPESAEIVPFPRKHIDAELLACLDPV